jgi:hypothetical protein
MWLHLLLFTGQFPSSISNTRSASQKITGHLFNLNIHHPDHSSQTVHPIFSQLHRVHILTLYNISFHFNIILRSTLLFSKWADPIQFSRYNFVCISSHIQVCHISTPSRPPRFEKASTPIHGTKHKLWIPSLCNFSHPPVNYALSSPNILLGTSFSNSLKIFPQSVRSDFIPIQSNRESYVCILQA